MRARKSSRKNLRELPLHLGRMECPSPESVDRKHVSRRKEERRKERPALAGHRSLEVIKKKSGR